MNAIMYQNPVALGSMLMTLHKKAARRRSSRLQSAKNALHTYRQWPATLVCQNLAAQVLIPIFATHQQGTYTCCKESTW